MSAKTLLYACDQKFFDYTLASFASFAEHNAIHSWNIVFADVGLTDPQRIELNKLGKVIRYPPSSDSNYGVNWPSARARMMALSEFTTGDDMLLYLDSDTLIFESFDGLVDAFLRSDASIGLFIENIEEWVRLPASFLWKDHQIPEVFANQARWSQNPFANGGVMLAKGVGARKVGETCLDLYERYSKDANFSEQSIIVSFLYDADIDFLKIPVKYNCLVEERHICHHGSGVKYVDTRPFFRGESVALRHFAGSYYKAALNDAMPFLPTQARLSKFLKKPK